MIVTLITPPSGFLLDERVFPALGILKVGASLEQAGHSVEHLDLAGVAQYEDVVRAHCRATQSRVFALTATTPQIPAAMKIVNVIKEALPDAHNILGGPHSTLVAAAAKQEDKKGREGRAHRALQELLNQFETVVAGDGERAITVAITQRGYIDADDPKSEWWLTSQGFTESPWPARHLLDVDSYHYTIDGERAMSMVSQLGCLDPSTPILLSSGEWLPIKDVQKGDSVFSFDPHTNRSADLPVAQKWEREADDLWELTWDDGGTVRITSEHPLWTSKGWQLVSNTEIGCHVAGVHSLRKTFQSSCENTARKVLQSALQVEVAEGKCEPEMAHSGAGKDASEVCSYDEGGALSLLHGSTQQHPCFNSPDSPSPIRNQKGNAQSHETSRCSGKSLRNYKKALGQLLLRTIQTMAPRRKAGAAYQWAKRCIAKSFRDFAHPNIAGSASQLLFCGEWCLLDRPMPIREEKESRFHKQNRSKGNPSSWGVLALRILKQNRSSRLQEARMESTCSVVPRIENPEQAKTTQKTEIVWRTLIGKRFIGRGKVHNITVHPVHTYFAAGLLVHNCPFECGFCGGRLSPMLRRMRLRSTENVVAEMEHLHRKYGVRGMMLYDDELNVNRGMVGLMVAIRELGDKYGFQWKLRGFVKAELFTDEQAQAMYAAGFRWLLCGFESAHPRILRNINKKATREDNTRMLRVAHQHGLKVKALMSFGHPGESEETILATRDWLLEEKPDDFDATVITEYPGTPYWDHSEQVYADVYRYRFAGDNLYSRDIDFNVEQAYYKGVPGEYHSFVWTDHLSAERLVAMRDSVEDEVRTKLGLKYPVAQVQQFEQSMGQHA